MPEDKTPSDILAELANVPFPNAAYVEAMKRVIDVQKQMLDGFQSNLDKWFERRKRRRGSHNHDAQRAERTSTDPGQRADAWQRWASGAMARIMEDVQTQYDLMSRITGKLASNRRSGPCPKSLEPSPPDRLPPGRLPMTRSSAPSSRAARPPAAREARTPKSK